MFFFLLLIDIVFAQTQSCNYLEPECMECLVCNPFGDPLYLKIASSNYTSRFIPSRVKDLTSIIGIMVYSIIGNFPPELEYLTNVTLIQIRAKILNTSTFPRLSFFKKLKSLDIYNSNFLSYDELKYLGGNATNLTMLTLISSNYSASFPSEILALTSLVNLRLVDLSLIGTIPNCTNLSRLRFLDLGNNLLEGTVIGDLFPETLVILNMPSNRLSGILPEFRLRMSNLDLGYNLFSGTIPASYSNISRFVLSNNNLTASNLVSPGIFTYIDVSHNNLNGPLPYSNTLTYLDVSYNVYTDILPDIYFMPNSGIYGQLNIAGNRISSLSRILSITRTITLYTPQDVDECTLGTHNCSQYGYCADGWNPKLSYTCACFSGFRLLGRECYDIDECLENSPCSHPLQCQNLIGSYRCCPDGYYFNGSECIDVNECTDNPLKLVAACNREESCVNLLGNYSCCEENTFNRYPEVLNTSCTACIGNYTNLTFNKQSFSSLENLTRVFYHQYCIGDCFSARYYLRSPRPSRGCINFTELIDYSCSYPCKNLTQYVSGQSAIYAIKIELTRGVLLQELFGNYSIEDTYSLTKSGMAISFKNGLSQDNYTLFLNLLAEIFPNLDVSMARNDSSIFFVTSEPPNFSIIVIGCICGVAALLFIALFYYSLRNMFNLRNLPSEVANSFFLFTLPLYCTFFTKYRGSSDTGYYYKKIDGRHILRNYEFVDLEVKSVTLVYNENLLNNFLGMYLILIKRLIEQKEIFAKKKWKRDTVDTDKRESVYQHFLNLKKYGNEQVSILPVCHGTDLAIAEKICETGFANLSSLDAGWYGKGIYFTSFPEYCMPYAAGKRNPCIILAWLLPGNFYPVIEDSDDKDSLTGTALKSGYQSHYVVTDKKGKIPQSIDDELYNEIVINQESQIVPYAIVEIDPTRAISRWLIKP